MSKNRKYLGSGLSTIWENTYGCDEYYICVTALYLLSILSQYFNIIIDCWINVPVHEIEVVDGRNATDKRLILRLMDTFQLPGSELFDTKMAAHTATHNTDVSLEL